ncbi:hypothetical protein KHQ81_15650 (plasmid) [Mycoplasmatota bacterium]|nr:hypothetical protein KHQ81_15650 [Mycoplasmatota bacterium]
MKDILKIKNVKARKEHICSWCGGVINKGEFYENSTVVNDGSFYIWKAHLKCNELTHKLDMWDCDDGDGLTSDDFGNCVLEFLYRELNDEEYEKITEKDLDEVIDIVLQML